MAPILRGTAEGTETRRRVHAETSVSARQGLATELSGRAVMASVVSCPKLAREISASCNLGARPRVLVADGDIDELARVSRRLCRWMLEFRLGARNQRTPRYSKEPGQGIQLLVCAGRCGCTDPHPCGGSCGGEANLPPVLRIDGAPARVHDFEVCGRREQRSPHGNFMSQHPAHFRRVLRGVIRSRCSHEAPVRAALFLQIAEDKFETSATK